jgi:branched-chain amino acid transport system substrate-binding protein
MSSPGVPLDKMPGGKGFADRFTGKYRPDPDLRAVCYDATWTLIDAMQKANSTDPAKYLPELAKTSRQGVTGPIGFDEKGDLKNGPITLYVVKDGKWEPLATVGGEAAAPAAAPAAPPRTSLPGNRRNRPPHRRPREEK